MNWITKHFSSIEDAIDFINNNRINLFGIVSDEESFFGGYYLMYKK